MEPNRRERGWRVGTDASACGVLLLLSAFFLAGIVQIAAWRGNVAAGYGLALLTASVMLATPKLLIGWMPVGSLSSFMGRHEGLRRAGESHALRFWLSTSQAVLIQAGLAIVKFSSEDTVGWVLFGIGCFLLTATYVCLVIFQAGYRTTRDLKNLPAGSDWCARVELDVDRVLGEDGVLKLAGLLLVVGTVVTALSL
jgi:hypothetical protein